MRRFTDEEIMAYADGEAPAEQARAIAEAARNDPVLAARVAQFEETRRVLKDAFARSLSEPVPERLKNVLRAPAKGNGAGSSKVVPLEARRSANAPAWVPMALAASVTLAIGLTAGNWLAKRGGEGTPEMVASAAVDPATLAQALEGAASGAPATSTVNGRRYEVLPTSTLQTADGSYCREFQASVEDVSGKREARGLACRQGEGRWVTQALVAVNDVGAGGPGGYRAASGGTVDFVSTLGGARPLTPSEESAQIAKRWSGTEH